MGWQLCKVTRAKTQATLPHRLSCRREQAEQKTEGAARGSSCSRTRRLGIGLLACDVTKSSGREQEAAGGGGGMPQCSCDASALGTREGEGAVDSTIISRAPPLCRPQSRYRGLSSELNRRPCCEGVLPTGREHARTRKHRDTRPCLAVKRAVMKTVAALRAWDGE